ncbi:hypothetical protein EHS25_003531 [Saitozyma podzolica]|uniref:Tudor domain-containing protein n=1 Tax=Saitozyma podzolica TaxID=1890683 RepID=A0A427Y7H3_9TREE|nr:hypothetical protein EHS25_003531 [Saitozyma podzolica]
MESEIQTYRDQLAYVNLSLEADPSNDDLLKLKTELVELIDLTTAAIAQTSAAAAKAAGGGEGSKAKGKGKESAVAKETSNWQDRGEYKAGMDCMAKYKDGKWYPARISAVVGSQDSPLYTITFKGYSSSTNVPVSALRPHDPSATIPQPQKRKEEPTEREKERKKAKGEKWMEKQKARADEVKDKKSAWDKFGKKASKKGIHIAGLEGRSVFQTPDNPFGRVGVTGSGRGVTDYARMGKHKFEEGREE